MRRVKSDSSLSSSQSTSQPHGTILHAPPAHITHNPLSRKSTSCTALYGYQEAILAETIIQAPISVAAPCLETYGFPTDILHSEQKTEDFLACILTPPDPVDKTPIIPQDEARDEQLRSAYDRLMRAYVMRRRRRVSEKSVE